MISPWSHWSHQRDYVSDSEKSEALADSLKAQFQQVNDPLVPAGIEMVNEGMRSYSFAPKVSLRQPTPRKFKTSFVVSNLTRHHAQTVFQIGP